MKRTLAITAATALLALSLAGCRAEGDGRVELEPGAGPDGTTATDTMRNDDGVAGTGTAGGATANADTAKNGGLGSVAGAVNGGYGPARYGTGTNGYAPTLPEKDAAAAGDRYALMLENGRVHDTDGFLLDGENTNWRTF